MTLVFKNEEKGTYFLMDTINNKIEFLTNKSYRDLDTYKHLIGGIEILTIPDYKTVLKFRKAVESGKFKDLPEDNKKDYVIDKFPEYFI